MTRISPALPFAIPGILACVMILGSATVLIVADSIKEGILVVSALAVGIAILCLMVGIIQASKAKQWNILGVLIAAISLFGVVVTRAITFYWFVNLLPWI
jgi:sulfite exporter TauE/SafE